MGLGWRGGEVFCVWWRSGYDLWLEGGGGEGERKFSRLWKIVIRKNEG